MNRRDEMILAKMLGYCAEVEAAHRLFRVDKALFLDEAKGAVYRNAVAMPILQIGELAKNLTEDFRSEHKTSLGETLFGCGICSPTIMARWTMSSFGIPRMRIWRRCVAGLHR